MGDMIFSCRMTYRTIDDISYTVAPYHRADLKKGGSGRLLGPYGGQERGASEEEAADNRKKSKVSDRRWFEPFGQHWVDQEGRVVEPPEGSERDRLVRLMEAWELFNRDGDDSLLVELGVVPAD